MHPDQLDGREFYPEEDATPSEEADDFDCRFREYMFGFAEYLNLLRMDSVFLEELCAEARLHVRHDWRKEGF